MNRFINRYQLKCEDLDSETLTRRELAVYVTGWNAAALLTGVGTGFDAERTDRIAAQVLTEGILSDEDTAYLRERVAQHLARLRRQSASDRAINAHQKSLQEKPSC